MSLYINGTGIKKVIINSTELNKLIINNTEVWTGKAPYYDEIKNATSNVTEEQWLAFVEGGGIAEVRANNDTSNFIGKNVTLSNTVASDKTSWKIADFNHDSSGNTCDLIQNNTVNSTIFGTASNKYSISHVKSWLTETYLLGFSTNVKNKLQNMTVTTNGTTSTNKIKLLSVTEVGGETGTIYAPSGEGIKYPIFTSNSSNNADSSRVRTGAMSLWWLRTPRLDHSSKIWSVSSDGSLGGALTYSNSCGVLPCIRFA